MTDQANITYAQLITLYEVSRKINSQLNLKILLDAIMDSAIELLHAEKGVLLLKRPDSDELSVEVARFLDKRSIDEVVALSQTVVKKVETEGKPVLLQNIPETAGTLPTTSIDRLKLKSVICVPLNSKDQLIGIIYLDTTDAKRFFKKADVSFLEGFANLAGIAIENARAYKAVENINANLETLVGQRTKEVQDKHQELQKAYDTLKSAQLQLLRSEKMASLGMLVAGIAHEINTPLGAINSNTDMFVRGFNKLQGKIKNANCEIEPLQKTLDVLENLANVNLEACDRITSIVKTLRNFARLDEEDFKKVNIHDGLDSTLALTAHLSRDRITVFKDYGDIPELACYANQLNQVFMNILVNSCQAIKDKGVISIKTAFEDDEIHITFSDTGEGIKAEIMDKIFDPGFTTKGVGVGTGLGLSISYKIVEEHGGRIEVQSEYGKGATFIVHLPLKNPNRV